VKKSDREMISSVLGELAVSVRVGFCWTNELRRNLNACFKLLDPKVKKVVISKKERRISRKYV
jgi:hypothetical protein